VLELLATLTFTAMLDTRPSPAPVSLSAQAVVQQAAPLRTGAPCSLQKGLRRTPPSSQRHERSSAALETLSLPRPFLPSTAAPDDADREARELPRGARLPRDPPASF